MRRPAAVLRCWPAVLLAVMARPVMARAPYLQAYGGKVLGLGALACLLAMLAVTPLAAVTGMRQPGRHRRWYGLWMAALGGAGLALALAGGLLTGIAGTARAWTGTLIVALLAPLAATASPRAQKALGAYWKRWHRPLTWAAWAVTGAHLAVLHADRAGTGFALASAPLLAARIPAVRRRISCRRKSRGTRRRWPAITALAVAYAAGMSVLAVLEARACGDAIRLAPA